MIRRVVLLVTVPAVDLGSPWWLAAEISFSMAGTDWTKYKRFIHMFLNDGHVTQPPDKFDFQNDN
jgi:hypothetical protein